MKKNKIICIYKITSPTNKVYIGQTIDYHRRKKRYKYSAQNQIILQNSFNKHGFNNHKMEILEECSVELLNDKERYWQEYYNVLENGLNCKLTSTNDKTGVLSEEVKIKIGNANRGNKYPSISKLMIGNKRGLNRKMTDLQKNKLSENRIGDKNPMYGKKPANSKKVKVYDLKNNFLFSCKSSMEAQRKTGVDFKNISAICNKKRKSGGGYIFKHD